MTQKGDRSKSEIELKPRWVDRLNFIFCNNSDKVGHKFTKLLGEMPQSDRWDLIVRYTQHPKSGARIGAISSTGPVYQQKYTEGEREAQDRVIARLAKLVQTDPVWEVRDYAAYKLIAILKEYPFFKQDPSSYPDVVKVIADHIETETVGGRYWPLEELTGLGDASHNFVLHLGMLPSASRLVESLGRVALEKNNRENVRNGATIILKDLNRTDAKEVLTKLAAEDTPYVSTNAKRAIELLEKAEKSGKQMSGTILLSEGVTILQFPSDRERQFENYLGLMSHLKTAQVYPQLKVFALSRVDPKASYPKLLLLTGPVEEIKKLQKVFHTREAEAFVAEKHANDWDRVNPASSVTSVPREGYSLDPKPYYDVLGEIRGNWYLVDSVF